MRFRRKRQTIDVVLLLERLDIKAQRVGTKWTGPCPHPDHESNPQAWMIRDLPGDPYHGTFVCKSCGFSGGPLKLITTVLDISQEDALEWMSDLNQPKPLPLAIEVVTRERDPLEMARPEVVRDWPDWDAEAIRYCMLIRGVTEIQITSWRLGAVKANARQPNGKPHRLKGRIWIPAYDRAQRLQSYTARAWDRDAEIRYKEPTKSEGVRPSAIYGEHLIGSRKYCIVAEGAFNAMAAARVSPDSVACCALAGSDPTTAQLLKLTSFEIVIVATDGDRAGKKAWLEIKQQIGSRVELRRACPPEGIDLNDMLDNDRAAFLAPALRGIV